MFKHTLHQFVHFTIFEDGKRVSYGNKSLRYCRYKYRICLVSESLAKQILLVYNAVFDVNELITTKP